ncbi:MAG: hypothetical protein BA066_06775 [Candidatus Korarchaeota archaeon NZ13-K]|nr:MAG: hypothetical protein BA066_06775 [Candidatus Korarchaeota archaeon NZ13-K]
MQTSLRTDAEISPQDYLDSIGPRAEAPAGVLTSPWPGLGGPMLRAGDDEDDLSSMAKSEVT